MNSIRLIFETILAVLLTVLITACTGTDGGSGPGTGVVSLSLTDAASPEYKAVYVTIQEVQVHRQNGGGWRVVATPNRTFNLLELANGVREDLGLSILQTGIYTQMRLIIGNTPDGGINIKSNNHPFANYFIDGLDAEYELKIPSSPQSGFKIGGFTINPNETTEIILDFNAAQSIVMAGNSGKWLLKPTVKVIDLANYSIIAGLANNMEGVSVSAQIFDPAAIDAKDRILVQAATLTDAGGAYKMFVEPGDYNVAAYMEGYFPACSAITAHPATIDQPPEFFLSLATGSDISGTVGITGAGDEQHVTLNFRRSIPCPGTSTPMEVKSVNVANGGSYTLNLPDGTYDVVASTYGRTTQEHVATISSPATTVLEISF